MRRISQLLIIVMLFTTSINTQVIHEILKRVSKHQRYLYTLKADVRTMEHKEFLNLARFISPEMCLEKPETVKFTETSFGKLNYLSRANRDNFYLRLDSLDESNETLLIKKRKYVIFQPKQKQTITGNFDTKDASQLFPLLSLSTKDLLTEYRVRKLRNAKINNEPTWRLQLIPKTYKSYKLIDLWIDKNGMIIKIKISEKNGNWKSVAFSNLQKNIKNFDARIFTLKLPKGTKIRYTK